MTDTMDQISEHDIDDLSLGAVFLATGGGGDPYVPQLLTKAVLNEFGPVSLIHPDALDDEAHIVTIGGVGAPTVSLELLPSIDEAVTALEAYEAHTGKKVDAIASFEIGGGNSLVPIAAAAAKGLPVVDGDGMGRALPEAQMMTYAIAGVCPSPAIALDYAGNVTSFTTKDTATYERHIRNLTMASGGMMTTVEHPMTGAEIKNAIIPGTVSFSVKLGRLLRENRGMASEMLTPLRAMFDASVYGECHLIYMGKVIDKSTRIVGGYDIGEATIEAFEKDASPLSISIKNEYLLAQVGGRTITSVPDLIVIVDYESSSPINAERLRYGQRVAVFAVACPEYFRSDRALEVVSPRAFGFDKDYVPLEKLVTNFAVG